MNIALERLPDECLYVAWLDADIIIEDHQWAAAACEVLREHPLLQLYAEAVHLPPGQTTATAGNVATSSIAGMFSKAQAHRQLLRQPFEAHGHTGFAWAARRSLLAAVGFYDRAIIGGGDHLLAHAFSASPNAPCIDRLLGTGTAARADFDRWAAVNCLPPADHLAFLGGRLFHLWHGPLAARRYGHRNRDLLRLGFDPQNELQLNEDKCWEWKNPDSACANQVRAYFAVRASDENR